MSLLKTVTGLMVVLVMNKQVCGSSYLFENLDQNVVYNILTESSTSGQSMLISTWYTNPSLLTQRFSSWTTQQQKVFASLLSHLNIENKNDIAKLLKITLTEPKTNKISSGHRFETDLW